MGVYIWNRLPSEYQEVEYIGRNGNNYIDTGWVPKLTAPFEVKVGCKISTSGVRYGILSNYNATSGEAGLTSLEINDGSHTNNVLRFYSERTSGSNSANIYSSNTLNLSGFNDIVYTNNGSSTGSVTLNGITTNGSVKTDGYSNLTAYLFIDRALRWSTYSHNSFISYCKIYESGTLVRDFIPCYRKSDSVIGLYDLVNNQFYTNSGTGTFTKGGDVNNYHEKELKNAYIGEFNPKDLLSNIIAYYPMQGNLNDESGNGYDLTTKLGSYTGGTSYNTMNNFAAGNTALVYNTSSSVTISSWYNRLTSTNTDTILFALGDDRTYPIPSGYGWGAMIFPTVASIVVNGSAYNTTAISLQTGWNMYSLVFDYTNKTLKFYLNAVLQSTKTGIGSGSIRGGTRCCIGTVKTENTSYNTQTVNGYQGITFATQNAMSANDLLAFCNATKSLYGL